MLKLTDFDFKKTDVSLKKIQRYKSEDSFMTLAVELLKEAAIVTSVISCAYRLDANNMPRKWTRNEAILGGLMVRLCKLQSSFLDQICQKRMETAMIILRCIGENLININYLLKNGSDEMYNKFIEYSLREEKRLLNEINSNISERGYELPVEKRIKKSILMSFEASDFKLEEVNEKNRQSWEETIYKRAKNIGMEKVYFIVFSLPSHDVHGNWQNLISNHLEYENNEFSPNTNWKMPRPQPLFGICVLSIETDKMFIDKILPDCPDREKINKMLDDINYRARLVDDLHEKFLQK